MVNDNRLKEVTGQYLNTKHSTTHTPLWHKLQGKEALLERGFYIFLHLKQALSLGLSLLVHTLMFLYCSQTISDPDIINFVVVIKTMPFVCFL